jgi:type I restriction-modification system DNA methylase subunit
MTIEQKKAQGRALIRDLVQKYENNKTDYRRATYNETQARTDFISPLLKALGWDVHNKASLPLSLREVVEEATVGVAVGDSLLTKKPDYELRLSRQRKLFVEAKKPSVHVERDRNAAFQTRRYGFSASLPISILTNFEQLAVYECKQAPTLNDEASFARTHLFRFEDYESRFDEMWALFSRDTVYSGEFDKQFAVVGSRHGTEQFDDLFLRQVRAWRLRLAEDIYANTPGLTSADLTYVVQLFLSRIIFLRICEDREIEKYETLKGLGDNTFGAFMKELRRADKFYNSGLFKLIDDEDLGITISDSVLREIISELYFPHSPYTFAVVETEVLGEIYEQFLGDVISIDGTGVQIVNKPEVRESGGVVPTPRYIVDKIVERTLAPSLTGKSLNELRGFTVVDPCCGSGVFLLSVYEYFLDHYQAWYVMNNKAAHVGRTIYEASEGQWRLTFEEKRRILLEHIRGVDIDANAVEVARFSLLLKLVEDETAAGLVDYVNRTGMPALPSLDETVVAGNSLVSSVEWNAINGPMSNDLAAKINPFTWQNEFKYEMSNGGFNAIVANPPYIRIQNMANYSPEEVAFYKNTASPYSTAHQDNFDKYALFIERSLSLLLPNGRLGVIVPNKFATTQSGSALRRLISDGQMLEELVHFGAKPVFGPSVSNYTCILVMDRAGCSNVKFERPGDLEAWRYGTPGKITQLDSTTLSEAKWQFADSEAQEVFDRVRTLAQRQLDDVAEIFVGLQTSADEIYIFEEVAATSKTVTLNWDGQGWPIERDILKPCLLDVQLSAFDKPEPNKWMIFPYEFVTKNNKTVAQLIQPKAMEKQFPKCYAYLKARKSELEGRSVSGGSAAHQQFYQFGRSQSLTKFDKPKIILPALSIEPRYVYDTDNIMVTGGGNGPYYLLRSCSNSPVSDLYLLAFLNHPFSEAFVRTKTSLFRGGYYAHGKQFIKDIPIPIPTSAQLAKVETLVMSLISTLSSLKKARTPHAKVPLKRQAENLRQQIEDEITGICRLSSSDMGVIRAVPIPV